MVDKSGNTNTESILDNENNINNNKSLDIKHVFSNRTLTEIFHRIKVKPLEPGSDQTTIVRHISKAIRNLQEVKILNTDDIDNEFLFTNNPFELVEPHRRLVCYCTVIHVGYNFFWLFIYYTVYYKSVCTIVKNNTFCHPYKHTVRKSLPVHFRHIPNLFTGRNSSSISETITRQSVYTFYKTLFELDMQQ